jgi:hypothetical protein
METVQRANTVGGEKQAEDAWARRRIAAVSVIESSVRHNFSSKPLDGRSVMMRPPTLPNELISEPHGGGFTAGI